MNLDYGGGRRPGSKDDPSSSSSIGGDAPLAPWITEPAQEAWAAVKGAGKSIAGAPGASLVEPKAVSDWAASQGDRPVAEEIGRQAPAIAASIMAPEAMGITRAMQTAPWLTRLALQAAQGAIGGGVEATMAPRSDVGRGAAEGAGTAAGVSLADEALRLGGRAIPGAGAGLVAASHALRHHGWGPYVAYHVLGPLTSLARRATSLPGGIAGVGGEWLAKELGYEESDDGSSR